MKSAISSKKSEKTPRRKDFKIGRLHGQLSTTVDKYENEIRNQLYQIANLDIVITRSNKTRVRLIGYEIPLAIKGKRIDLLGYDNQLNPYLIELKRGDSSDTLQDISDQLRKYEDYMVLKKYNMKTHEIEAGIHKTS